MRIVIKGEFTDLNAYIKALNNNRYKGNSIKKEETNRVYWSAKISKVKPVKNYPVIIGFTWFVKNKMKDPDNIAFSKKYILDGLVLAKVLKDDSQRYIRGFSGEYFHIDKENPRVEIRIEEEYQLTKEEKEKFDDMFVEMSGEEYLDKFKV